MCGCFGTVRNNNLTLYPSIHFLFLECTHNVTILVHSLFYCLYIFNSWRSVNKQHKIGAWQVRASDITFDQKHSNGSRLVIWHRTKNYFCLIISTIEKLTEKICWTKKCFIFLYNFLFEPFSLRYVFRDLRSRSAQKRMKVFM